jgi:hypothetical protein
MREGDEPMHRAWHTLWMLMAAAAWLAATSPPCHAAAADDSAPEATAAVPAAAAPNAPSKAEEAGAADAPSAEAADEPAEATGEEPSKTADDEPGDGSPDEPGEEADERPKGQKVMRLEDIKDLPPLTRYELPLEKGEALLGDVQDNTFGYDESAFWWLVHLVHKLPDEAFEPGDVTAGFAQLLAMPSSYRGKPVTIKGAYGSCSPFRTPILAVRKDVPVLYECNIIELPLEERRPVATVIVLEDPMEDLRVYDTVKARGYFYKVRRYEKQGGGESLAPMLVAKRLVPVGRSAGSRKPSSTVDMGGSTVLLVFMIAAVLALGVVYVFLRYKTKATPHAADPGAGHRFNLRRPDRSGPAGPGGPGSEDGGAES